MLRVLTILILSVLFISCNQKESLFGKKLYTLNANLGSISVVEYEMFFFSEDMVQFSRSLYCDSYSCTSKGKNKKSAESIIRNYTYEDGILQIEGVSNLFKLEFNENGEAMAQDGYTLYTTPIKEASKEEQRERMIDVFKGKESIAGVFIKLLSNGAYKPLIEQRGDKIYFTDNSSTSSVEESIQSQFASTTATDLFQFNSSSELIALFGKENVKKQEAYGFEGQERGYEYVLYPGTSKEAIFYFAGDRLETITFKRKSSYWQLPGGVKVGMRVDEVERINSKPFKIANLEVDYAGIVLDWKSGTLEDTGVQMTFESTKNEMTPEEYNSFGDFKSNKEGIQKLGLVVKEISIKAH